MSLSSSDEFKSNWFLWLNAPDLTFSFLWTFNEAFIFKLALSNFRCNFVGGMWFSYRSGIIWLDEFPCSSVVETSIERLLVSTLCSSDTWWWRRFFVRRPDRLKGQGVSGSTGSVGFTWQIVPEENLFCSGTTRVRRVAGAVIVRSEVS